MEVKYRSVDVNNYLRDMNTFNRLNIFQGKEGQLIYAALHKSNKLSVYQELAEGERTSLDNFSKYIRETYGGSTDSIRKELSELIKPEMNPTNRFLEE